MTQQLPVGYPIVQNGIRVRPDFSASLLCAAPRYTAQGKTTTRSQRLFCAFRESSVSSIGGKSKWDDLENPGLPTGDLFSWIMQDQAQMNSTMHQFAIVAVNGG